MPRPRSTSLRPVVGIMAAALALAGAGLAPNLTSPAGAAAAGCAKAKPTVVFVGDVTGMVDDTVDFRVIAVRSGALPDATVSITYPSRYNARKLDVGHRYLVAATKRGAAFSSVVPTAQVSSCDKTRNADGSRIDTGALAGVKEAAPGVVRTVALIVVGALVVLVLLGRFFDRKARYRTTGGTVDGGPVEGRGSKAGRGAAQ